MQAKYSRKILFQQPRRDNKISSLYGNLIKCNFNSTVLEGVHQMYLVYSHCINNILGTREKMRKWDCIFVNISRNCVVIFFWLYKVIFQVFNLGSGSEQREGRQQIFFQFWKSSGISKEDRNLPQGPHKHDLLFELIKHQINLATCKFAKQKLALHNLSPS